MSAKNPGHYFSIDLFCKGDMQEYNYVFELYYDTMYLFAYNMIRTQGEAKDIATESFIKLWKLHSNFENLGNIKAFLYVTTRNACIDYLRFLQKQRAAQREIFYLLDKDKEETPKNEMIDAEVFKKLSQQIEALPPKCKEVFKLIYFHNFSTAQIAKKMAITQRNVLNQKARGIQLLQSALFSRTLRDTVVLMLLLFLK